jgi:cobalamin synthase
MFNLNAVRQVLSFYTCFPVRVLIVDKKKYYKKLGQSYPYIAILLNGAINSLALLLLYPLLQKFEISFLSIFLLFLYYLLRGLKLIDGYTDLSEGLSLTHRHTKSVDEIWQVIRNSSNGAFGILWTVLLILFQFTLFKSLLTKPFFISIILFSMCGSASSLSVLVSHIGKNNYRADSDFWVFAEEIKRYKSFFISLIIFLFSYFIVLNIIYPLNTVIAFLTVTSIAAIAIGGFLRVFIKKALKNFNGDFIGFNILVSETLLLLILIVFL